MQLLGQLHDLEGFALRPKCRAPPLRQSELSSVNHHRYPALKSKVELQRRLIFFLTVESPNVRIKKGKQQWHLLGA